MEVGIGITMRQEAISCNDLQLKTRKPAISAFFDRN
jgi:hypothetical protein